jgi:hypothetical protein
MILNSNVSLVAGRGTGIGKLNKISSLGDSKSTAINTKLLLRAASTNKTARIDGKFRTRLAEDQTTMTYLATKGGAQANHDPLKHIDKLIKHHKPDLQAACEPDTMYKK